MDMCRCGWKRRWRQLSKEKQESETAMLENVRAETAKALEQAQEVSKPTG